MNYDLLNEEKCQPLSNVCDVCNLENIVKEPTCHTKGAKPSLIDVILTNSKQYLQNTINFNCSLSDVHNFIGIQMKGNIPPMTAPHKSYRSFKNFNQEAFLLDLKMQT